MGHKQAIRDVNFNNAGDQFLSASYDRNNNFFYNTQYVVLILYNRLNIIVTHTSFQVYFINACNRKFNKDPLSKKDFT
jgi:hypothetical protein